VNKGDLPYKLWYSFFIPFVPIVIYQDIWECILAHFPLELLTIPARGRLKIVGGGGSYECTAPVI